MIDDGRTIAHMDFDGMPWLQRRKRSQKNKDQPSEWDKLDLSRKERRAMIFGGILAILPWAFLYAALFFLAMLFLDFVWLR